ncbi:hypothetical protein [Plantibacter sp. M259]|uniref:hypothetical protein n=1 Tax=Plantibacter sp. M259 TaxID=2583822 RepID=UPI0011101BE5|nr:hypothetical protein [Plantibacter sp. M259]
MVLQLEPELLAALEENHEPGWRADAFYGPTLTAADVPLTWDGSLTFAGDAQVQGRGTVRLARDNDSLVPKAKTDPLAPFGQELAITRTVTVGSKTWDIPMGRFRIFEVPSMREYLRLYPSQAQVIGWDAELSLRDRFEAIIADDFLQTEAPKPGNTVWQEIRRLSPYPIVQSLPDTTIPAGVAYKSRIDAIEVLMAALGGVPHLTRQGALTARPADVWLTATEPVATVKGVIDLDDSLSMDFYNQVQVTSSTGGNDLVAVARITDMSNPIAVGRPIGGRTYRYSSPLLDTQAKVNAAAKTVLARVSGRQSRAVRVSCLPRPDLELGDYIEVVDEAQGREVVGEVTSMTFPMNPTDAMTVELIAAETR